MLSLRRGTVKSRTSRALERLRAAAGGERMSSSSSASSRSATRSSSPRRRASSSRSTAGAARAATAAAARARLRGPARRARRRARVLRGRPQRVPRDLPHAGRDRRARRELPEVEAQRFDFGERVTRAEAERRVGFELVDLGEPDAIFVRGDRVASLVYGVGATSRGSCSRSSAAGSGTASSRRSAAPARASSRSRSTASAGLFISGDEHFVMFFGRERRDHGRAHVPRGHGAALEPRAAAAPPRGRPDARRGARAREHRR